MTRKWVNERTGRRSCSSLGACGIREFAACAHRLNGGKQNGRFIYFPDDSTLISYARVSTGEQSLTLQIDVLEEIGYE